MFSIQKTFPPPVSPYINESPLITPLRPINVSTKPLRKLIVLNAVDVDIVSNSDSLPLIKVAGLSLVALSAIAISTQFPQRANVTSISALKLPAILADRQSVLIDIRSKLEIKKSGQPNLNDFNCRFISAPYIKRSKNGQMEVIANFGESCVKQRGLSITSKVILMDSNGKHAAAAAREILKFLDIKAIYYVASGVTGRGGLKESGFSWKENQRGVSIPTIKINTQNLEKLAKSYRKRPNLINAGLAVSALVTAGLVLFNQIDVLLEVVGVLGAANLIFRNLFFAKDRKKTIEDLDALVNDKIAAKEAGNDLKRIADTILEAPSNTEKPEAKQMQKEASMSTPVSVKDV
eukprot:g2181.t1